MTQAEIQEHIEYLLTIITNLRLAIIALSTGQEKSYSVNTGQTVMSATKKDLRSLREFLQSSLEDLQEFRGMLTDGETGAEILRAL